MKKIIKLLTFLLLFCSLAKAQSGNTLLISFPGVPTGACSFLMVALNSANGDYYDCWLGSWHKVGPSAAGGFPRLDQVFDPAANKTFLMGGFFVNFSNAAYVASPIFDAATGYRVAGGAVAGKVLIGDGTNFVPGDPMVQGLVAHDDVDTSNPVLIGGFASAAAPTNVSADGDAVNTWHLRNGSPVVNLATGGTLYDARSIRALSSVGDSVTISGSISNTTFGATQGTSPWVISGAVTTSGTATVSGTVTADQGAAGASAWPVKISQSGTDSTVVATQSTGTNLHTVIDSGTVTATVATTSATQGTDPWNENLKQINAHTTVEGGQNGTLAVGGATATNTNVSSATNPLLVAGSDYGGTPKVQSLKVDSSGNAQVAVTNSPAVTIISGSVSATQGTSPWVVGQSTGSNLHAVIDSGSTTAVTQGTGTNLHTVVDSGSITATQGTGTNLHTVVDSGSITATQGTGTNLHTVVDSGTITTVSTVTSITNQVDTNLKQVGGGNTATSGTGVQKVGITGNAAATLDSTVGAGTAPTNQIVTGAIYNATIPAPTDTQALAIQTDQNGNTRVSQGIALKTLSGWTSGTALNATQTIFSNSGVGAVLVHLVQGTTISGGAITFEVSYDNSNWVTIPADAVLDPSSTTFSQISLPYTLVQSTNKPFLLMGKGWQGLRIKLSTQITGSATVTPNYALLAYEPAKTTIALSPTAANLNAAVVGTGTAGSPAGNILTVQGVASMTKLLVTPDSVALPANQSVNVAQINATTPLMGLGASGTGSPRTTTAYADTPTVGAILCESTKVYDASTNGATQLVAASGSKKIYVCGYNFFAAGTVNVKLMSATSGTCATTTDLTPAYQFTAQTGIVQPVSNSPGIVTPASSQLCINTSAGVAVQALVWYAQF